MTGRILLRCEGLTVSFGGVHALRDVGLELRGGEIASVVGPNGAGKTTLLNAICGAAPLERGRATVLASPNAGRPVEYCRAGIGRSFQAPRLLEKASLVENVVLGMHVTLDYSMLDQLVRPGRVRRAEQRAAARARELLDLVGLGKQADDPVSSLAFGPRKMVDILRALASEPDIVLLDEPSSGLDRRERGAIGDLLLELRRSRSAGYLLVEHNMDLVRKLSDRVLGLAAGAIVAEGSAAEVLESEAFLAALTGGAGTHTEGEGE